MKTICVSVIKGGTGKTTTAAALAQYEQRQGKKVLAVDLDPQSNLTAYLKAHTAPGIVDLLKGNADPEDLIQATEQGIYIIPGSPELATFINYKGSAWTLRNALEPMKDRFDRIVIDTPPQIGALTLAGLYAADGVITPLETDPGSLTGLDHIADIAELIRAKTKGLEFLGTLVTRYDPRAKLNAALLKAIKDRAAGRGFAFLGCIRSGVAVREAQTLRKNLVEYAPKSNPARDYKTAFETLTTGENRS